MLRPGVRTTMEEIDAALAAAQLEPEKPSFVHAEYLRDHDLFLLKISDGRRLAIPREDIWAVRNATPDQAADFIAEPPAPTLVAPARRRSLHPGSPRRPLRQQSLDGSRPPLRLGRRINHLKRARVPRASASGLILAEEQRAAFAVAFAFLSIIPEGNLLLLLPVLRCHPGP
jgi:hypothetical protein